MKQRLQIKIKNRVKHTNGKRKSREREREKNRAVANDNYDFIIRIVCFWLIITVWHNFSNLVVKTIIINITTII